MRVLHQKLHLQHHRHTGRVLHHKHTSYRGLAVVLVLASSVMIGLNLMARATADSLYVYARIAAPVPTDPPVITSPTDGTVTNEAGMQVSGSCPVVSPAVIIAILDNDVEVGSVACDGSNHFQVTVTLSPGKNVLVARPYTITDDTGPDSAPVTVTYDASTPPEALGTPSGTGATGSPSSNLPPLVLAVDRPFIVFGPTKNALWTGSITGGTAPYKVRIDWGDGTVNILRVSKSGAQSFHHRYRAMQPYGITMQVNDATGQQVVRHYAAVTPYQPPVISGLSTTTPGSFSGLSGPNVIGVYGAYLTLLATFGIVWLHAHPFAYAKVPAAHHIVRRRTSRR